MAAAEAGAPEGRPASLTSMAWAKVNLFLHVTGRREDGYHELDSLVVFAGVGDRLSFEPAEGLSLEIGGPLGAGLPAGDDNLVLRAARLLAEAAGRPLGARIRLEKHLPAAAGIGGGSADAAATLRALAALHGLGDIDLAALGARLGADIPVCLYGRPAFMGGVGERIERAPPLPAAWLVLANPGLPLSTPAVFKAREGGFSQPGRWAEAAESAATLADWLSERRNDLEPPARVLAPVVDRVLAALSEPDSCLLARLSGSGATCFGLYARRAEAEAAAAALGEGHPDWWCAAAPLLQGPLERAFWEEERAA